MNGSRWRGWIAAAAIFALGIAVGSGGAAWAAAHWLRQVIQAPASAPGLADRAAERIGADLSKNLQLTPNESIRVQAIIDQSAGNLKALRVRAATQAIAELRGSVERIAGELPPRKRGEFYRLIAQRYERIGLTLPALEKAQEAKPGSSLPP